MCLITVVGSEVSLRAGTYARARLSAPCCGFPGIGLTTLNGRTEFSARPFPRLSEAFWARRGLAGGVWQGMAGLGAAWQARRGRARSGRARRGLAGMARRGEAWQGLAGVAWQGWARLGKARFGRQGRARLGMVWQGRRGRHGSAGALAGPCKADHVASVVASVAYESACFSGRARIIWQKATTMKRGREYLFIGLRDRPMARPRRVPVRAIPSPWDLTAFAAGMVLGACLAVAGVTL